MRRPSLFILRAICENIDKSSGHRIRFNELAFSTPKLRNRSSMLSYLDLLEDLEWISKEKRVIDAPWYPAGSRHRRKGTTIHYFQLTDRGKEFLGLFPKDSNQMVTSDAVS